MDAHDDLPRHPLELQPRFSLLAPLIGRDGIAMLGWDTACAPELGRLFRSIHTDENLEAMEALRILSRWIAVGCLSLVVDDVVHDYAVFRDPVDGARSHLGGLARIHERPFQVSRFDAPIPVTIVNVWTILHRDQILAADALQFTGPNRSLLVVGTIRANTFEPDFYVSTQPDVKVNLQ